jgi:hypothetical protein
MRCERFAMNECAASSASLQTILYVMNFDDRSMPGLSVDGGKGLVSFAMAQAYVREG